MKQALVKSGAALLRSCLRHVPLIAGKRAVWNHVVQPLLPYVDIPLEAETWFGARMQLRFPDTIQSYLYFFGVWEPAISVYLARTLRPGDIVIDIGANVGYDSLLAAHCVGPTGRVYAIEASPSLFHLLAENLGRNDAACVTPIHAAVSAQAGPVPVFLHDRRNLGGTTIVPSVARRRGATLEALVRGDTLPRLVPEADIRAARLIKIDVEGAEWPVVQGFARLLPYLSPRTELLIEVNTEGLIDHGCDPAAFFRPFQRARLQPFLVPNGYSVDTYLNPADLRLKPYAGDAFDQVDVLFQRVPEDAGVTPDDPPAALEQPRQKTLPDEATVTAPAPRHART